MKNKLIFRYFVMAGIIITIFLLYFLRIDREGYSNPYYAAAVKSMITDWHDFFYISFDSEGYVSVDKPPLGLWIQALSAMVMGFKGWVLILPQILSAIISIILIYFIVRKTFGEKAGLISAFALAITPIMVAVSRSNNLDTIVVMLLLMATWYIILACEKENLKYFILAMIFTGLGFNVKMLQAFMVLPAFYLIYFFTTSLKRNVKLIHLAVSTLVLLIVSLSWAIIVDLTPPENRPYVGGSHNNSVFELIVGYNGIMRVIPPPPPGVHPPGPPGGSPGEPPQPDNNYPGTPGDTSIKHPPPGPPPIFMETGYPGLFRLFNKQMAGQISWLLPLALMGLIALLKIEKEENVNKKRQLALWTLWTVPMILYFSISGFFHRYYLVMLGPAISALVGISLSGLWNIYHKKEKKWLLPSIIALNWLIEGILLMKHEGWHIFATVIILLSFIFAVIMFLSKNKTIQKTTLILGMAAIFVPPLIWSFTPVIYGNDPRLPFAGPELSERNSRGKMHPTHMEKMKNLIKFLEENKKNESFLIAVPDANIASDIILETGEAVMAVGGFNGQDRILTAEGLKEMVKLGKLRFYLVIEIPEFPGPDFPFFKKRGASLEELNDWVKKNGLEVPEEKVKIEIPQPPGPPDMPSPEIKLYDLKN